MGLFKSIKKAFKKVTRGIKKVVKGVVKGVKKVVKKISSSKILKALAIAAAVVVTGGAALGAMGATAGAGGFTGWMVGASNAITGFTVAGLPVGAVMKPFASIGSAIGSGVSAVTGINLAQPTVALPNTIATPSAVSGTTATTAEIAAGTDALSTTVATLADPTINPAITASQAATGQALSIPTKIIPDTLSQSQLLSGVNPATAAANATAGGLNLPATLSSGMTPLTEAQILAGQNPATVAAASSNAAKATQSWAARNPKTASFLGTVGTGVATSVATGYAMQQIAGDPEETGSMAGLRTEGASSFDPLRVYAAERGIADSDISKYFTFGNTAEAGNMPLFQQQTIGVMA